MMPFTAVNEGARTIVTCLRCGERVPMSHATTEWEARHTCRFWIFERKCKRV